MGRPIDRSQPNPGEAPAGYVYDRLFTMTSEVEDMDELVSQKALIGQVVTAAQMVGPIAELLVPGYAASVEAKHPSSKLKGGAFGGALKRRIEQTNSAEKLAATNQHDIDLLTPENIRDELFHVDGDQVYDGVLLTPTEYNAVTLSPRAAARRIGANVLANTTDRPPTDRHARKKEVVGESLAKRSEKANDVLTALATDEKVLSTIMKEMRTPGYSHMPQPEMDGLMDHAEGVFISMFEAIVTNRGLGTERVESLTAALDYLLTRSNEKYDYQHTFTYWKRMTNLGLTWTRTKAVHFKAMQSKITQEAASRS